MTTKNDDREIHVNELFKFLKFLEVHQQFNFNTQVLPNKCTRYLTVQQTSKFSLILDMKYQKDLKVKIKTSSSLTTEIYTNLA